MDEFEHHNNLRDKINELKSLPKLDIDGNRIPEDSGPNGLKKAEIDEKSVDGTPEESGPNGLTKISSISTCTPNGSFSQKTAGRYRMNPEDKLKSKSFRLSEADSEILSMAPGNNDSEKLRYILKNHYRYQLKMNRYSRRLKTAISHAYSDLRSCVDPELHNHDNIKKKKLIQNFKESYLELVAVIEFFEFDTLDFDELLDNRENSKLSAVLMGKESLL